jgi:hypothetical protein
MIINLPGKIRVEHLASELFPVWEAVRDMEADTLTTVAISFRNFFRGNPIGSDHRRLMQYQGSIEAAAFPAIVTSMIRMLRESDVELVDELEFSFQAWRGEERAQVWGEDGFIKQMVFDAQPGSDGGVNVRVCRPDTSVRYRPHDKQVNLFAVLFGHDD